RDKLEEQVRGVLLEGKVADFVDDDQPVTAQPCELFREVALSVGVGEAGDPVRRGGEQRVGMLGGHQATPSIPTALSSCVRSRVSSSTGAVRGCWNCCDNRFAASR